MTREQKCTIEAALKLVNDARLANGEMPEDTAYLHGMERAITLLGYTVDFDPLTGRFTISELEG